MENLKVGQLVEVKCPTYKNDRKFRGKILEVRRNPKYKYQLQYKVKIDDNSKGTIFSEHWVSALKEPHFSELTKALSNPLLNS